jgi:DNA-binding response OmpR family regulator
VVVVDDEADVRDYLRGLLEARGFEVLAVETGWRLLGILDAEPPAVILLDVVMGWVNGLDLCRALKRNPRFRDTPVCFISGRSAPADVKAGMDCGAIAYLAKPLDPVEVMRIVDECVARRAASKAPPPAGA